MLLTLWVNERYLIDTVIFNPKSQIKIRNQYVDKPATIVARILLLNIPTITAIIDAKILGLSSKRNDPELSKKIAGNIIAGKIADGTYDKTSLILSLNISFLRRAIIENLVRKVINPQYIIKAQSLIFLKSELVSLP